MGFWNRLTGTFKTTSDVQQEIEFHVEQRASELIASGAAQEDALRQARREFGNTAKWREETRDADVFVTLENWARDTRQSLRGLLQRPLFALTAIGSLAIGIGSIASLFAIADAVIWKPVALPNEGQLYVLDEAKRGTPTGSNGQRLKDWQTLTSITAATGTYTESIVWRGPSGNQAVRAVRTYTGAMATAQPPVAMGRGFTKEEEGGEPVALVTDAFWRKFLNAESFTERTITLSGNAYRIIGVLDASVGYPDGIDFWIPAKAGQQNDPRTAGYLGILLRLKPGVPLQQVNAEIALTTSRLRQAYPTTDANLSATLAPLRERISREARTALFALLAVVACVLTMICVNIAALLLTRGTEREREAALRSALGASPASLIRLYLIEALLLAFAGGTAGVLLALAGVRFLKHILPGELPRLSDAQVDLRVLTFVLLTSVLAALAAGLVPAWIATRRTTLHDSSRGVSARADRKRIRTIFVVAEIALSVLLVTTGVRLGQAFMELAQRPLSFRTDEILAVTVPFGWTDSSERISTFETRATERFATLPGVTQVGLVDAFPLLGGTQSGDIHILGDTSGTPHPSGHRAASPNYFATLSVPLLEGRMFDANPERLEVVVNQAFAKLYLADGRPAAAHQVAFDRVESKDKKTPQDWNWRQVVGVVADLPQDPSKEGAEPEVFQNFLQSYWPYLNFAIHSTAPASVLAPLIREEVAKLDGAVIAGHIGPLKDRLGESVADRGVRSALVGAAAALALLLMAIGIHGLIAGDVANRWREFGVRLAMGATIPSIRRLLLQKIAALALAGIAVGIGAVLLTSNLLESAFQNLAPASVPTLLVVCLTIALAALSAILWPLYRIGRIDPSTALRHE